MSRAPANPSSQSWAASLWILAAGLILCSGVLLHPVDGHSFYLNITWHHGFLAELRAGQWYPRWLSSSNQGLGAPSFHFYAPFPFYVSAALDLLWPLPHGPDFGPVAAAVLAIILSGLTMFALLRSLHGPRVGLPVAMVFMAMPYHFGIDFWWRAAFGEIWAFVWLPLLALGVVRLAQGRGHGALIVGAAAVGMILSHLPSFVIGLCGLGAAGAIPALAALAGRVDPGRTIRAMMTAAAAIFIALLVTAAYWYPALMTADHTVMAQYMTQGWYAYSTNFIFSPHTFRENGPIQLAALAVFGAGLAAAVFAILRKQVESIAFLGGLAALFTSFLLMTGLSDPLYQLLPPLQRLQFPWRFLIVSEIALALILAHALAISGSGRPDDSLPFPGALHAAAAAGVILLFAFATPAFMRPVYTADDATRVKVYLQTRADGEEYRTRWTPIDSYTDFNFARRPAPRAPRFADETADATLSGTRERPGKLVFNRYWYPDFAARDRLNGLDLVTSADPVTGLAVAEVPAGPYAIATERRALPEETSGYRLSYAGLLLAMVWTGIGALGRSTPVGAGTRRP